MPGFGGKSSRNLGSRVPKDIDGGVTKSSIIEENRQFPQSGLTCARQDDVAVRIVDLKALEGDRPPETRRLAHPEGGDQTDDSADEKEPAIQDLDCERGDRRNNDGGQTEDDENDPLDQKEHPMLVQRCRHRALNLLDVGLVHRHGRPPWGVVALASFTWQSQFAADCPVRNQRLKAVFLARTRSSTLVILGQCDNTNWANPVRCTVVFLFGKFFFRFQGGKDGLDVYPSWANLGGGWTIMALDRWLRLGRLPRLYRRRAPEFLPITSGLLISVALTLFLWLVNR